MSLTLQPLLRLRYRRETWTTLLLDLFPDGAVSILAAPAEIDVTHEQVTATRQLGHIVHQLFHLTPAEIALIEEAVGG